jgi:IS5 family transposase
VPYADKAHVAVDETHTLIRAVTWTSANVPDRQEFDTVARSDEQTGCADQAYGRRARNEGCERLDVDNGIGEKAARGRKLGAAAARLNRLLSGGRCRIEKVFGWWKRSTGYRRVRYVGRAANRLEREFKSIRGNLKRLTTLQRL